MASNIPLSFVTRWKGLLLSKEQEQRNDFPFYDNPDGSLVTQCTPRSIRTGSGVSIFKEGLLPAIATAQHEVILVTCFWANSPTLAALKGTLEKLAETRKSWPESGGAARHPLRVHIGFSSRSVFQKLFHTWSRDGYVYPPKSWSKLGLPDENVLREGNIELTVKSLFFLPFSVMHPKYLVVDRRRAWMPSCNVSWEVWFETCVEFDGPAIDALLGFHSRVWDRTATRRVEWGRDMAANDGAVRQENGSGSRPPNSAQVVYRFPESAVPAILLPSSHHQNPRFQLPFLRPLSVPTTPLNTAVLTLIENAERFVQITTPNLTCQAVMDALLLALQRGVTVHIRTSKNMMVLEQLVTAGTTTAWCVKSFIKRYKRLCSPASDGGDVEMARLRPGHLKIMYYKPDLHSSEAGQKDPGEPVVSHVKMVQVDGEYLVLGSGNMDRASWYTSQELGIMFYMPGFEDLWSRPLETRLAVVFEG